MKEKKIYLRNIEYILDKYGFKSITLSVFIAVSMGITANGCEMTLMALFLIPLKKYFDLSNFQLQVISSILFLGVSIGSYCSGYILTKFQRKTIVINSYIAIFIFHTLLSFVPNYIFFSIARFFIGFFLGLIVPISLNSLGEFLPTNHRAFILTSIWVFFSVGQAFISIFMLIGMPNFELDNMKYVLFSLNSLVVASLILNDNFFVESPRYLLMKHENEHAFELLNQMLVEIDEEKLSFEEKENLIQENDKHKEENLNQESNFMVLFSEDYYDTTVLSIGILFILSFLLYGILIISTLTMKEFNEKKKPKIKKVEISSFFEIINNTNNTMNDIFDTVYNDNISINSIINETIIEPINESFNNTINNTFNNELNNSIDFPINETIKNELNNSINSPTNETIKNEENNSIVSPINETIKNEENNSIVSPINISNENINIINNISNNDIEIKKNDTKINSINNSFPTNQNSIKEKEKKEHNYPKILIGQFISAFVSMFGCIIGGVLCEIPYFGRKKTIFLGFIICCISLLLILIIGEEFFTELYSVYLAFVLVSFNVFLTYIVEVYPTRLRDISSGFLFGCLRMSGFLSQYFYLSINHFHFLLPYFFSMLIAFLAACFAYKLPYETCDQPLDFSFSKLDDDSEEKLFTK